MESKTDASVSKEVRKQKTISNERLNDYWREEREKVIVVGIRSYTSIEENQISYSTLHNLFYLMKYLTISLDVGPDTTSPEMYLELLSNFHKAFRQVEAVNSSIHTRGNRKDKYFIVDKNLEKNTLTQVSAIERIKTDDNFFIRLLISSQDIKYKSYINILISLLPFMNSSQSVSKTPFFDPEYIVLLKNQMKNEDLKESFKNNVFLNILNDLKTNLNVYRSSLQFFNISTEALGLSVLSESKKTRDDKIINGAALFVSVYIKGIFFLYFIFYKLKTNGIKQYPEGRDLYQSLINELENIDFSGNFDHVTFFKLLFEDSGEELQRNFEMIVETLGPIILILKDMRRIIDSLPDNIYPPSTTNQNQVKNRVFFVMTELTEQINLREEISDFNPFNIYWMVDYIYKMIISNIKVEIKGKRTTEPRVVSEKLQVLLRSILPEKNFLSLINWIDYCENGAAKYSPQFNMENMFIRGTNFGK